MDTKFNVSLHISLVVVKASSTVDYISGSTVPSQKYPVGPRK